MRPALDARSRRVGIARGEIFLTTKLPAHIKDASRVEETFQKSLTTLGVDYVDLYLIHAPWPWDEQGADYTNENIAVWHEMEKLYRSGRAKAIGVSNFNVHDLTAILDNGSVVPAANQIRWFIGYTEDDITTFSKRRGVLIEAYSPLATGRILGNPDLKRWPENTARRWRRSPFATACNMKRCPCRNQPTTSTL